MKNISEQLGPQDLESLTRIAVRRQRAIHFAGFLVREDEQAIYVADTLGTWIIPRNSLAFMEDWQGSERCVPPEMQAMGRPVRVGVNDGATIHELRPWKMEISLNEAFHRDLRRAADQVFTLGGPTPVGPHTATGEEKLEQLEKVFSRQLGWNPSDPCTSPVGRDGGTISAGSHTIVVNDGYCDSDPTF
jgi:hypothetical protein